MEKPDIDPIMRVLDRVSIAMQYARNGHTTLGYAYLSDLYSPMEGVDTMAMTRVAMKKFSSRWSIAIQ